MRGWAIVWLDDGATADSQILRSWLEILQTGITHSIISTRRNTFSLHVKFPLLLPDFNQNWNMPTKFSEVLELLHVYWWRVSDFNGRSVGLWTRQNGRMEDNRTVSDFELHSKLPIFTIWRLSQCVFFPPCLSLCWIRYFHSHWVEPSAPRVCCIRSTAVLLFCFGV